MVMKKFCNRCGRLIEADEVCVCRKNVKREYRHIDFYDGKAWRKLSSYIKVRDYMQDRVQLYFGKYQPVGDIEQIIYGYVMDAYGQPRRFGNKLITHHIVPREDNYSLQYYNNYTISYIP